MPKKTKSGISKGPWKMFRFPAARGEDWRIVEDAKGKVVGEIQHVGNATLIQYAPDLLRTAKAVLRQTDQGLPAGSYGEALRAAILKAEGH